ncbi:hypothetical protein [Natrarchaeobius chitinivorans]|nr:hypothetical protein [Natrarchaeobius chitinivorans]
MNPLTIPGAPAGPEVLVLLLVNIALPLFVLGFVVLFLDRKRRYDERLTALEERTAELENGRP